MVTAKEKCVIDIHTKKKKETKYNTKDSHQITSKENKRQDGCVLLFSLLVI